MTTTPATQAGLFPRIVTHEQARQAAKNFIDAHFNNPDGKGVLTGIPARDDHDDIVLTDYIKQRAATLRALNIMNAVLDLPLANTAPIEWDDADWHQVRRALAALPSHQGAGE